MQGSVTSGSGIGKGKQKSRAGSQLEQYAGQFFQETTPMRQELIGQFEEILKTGGAQAQVPIIAKAVESSKKAASDTVAQTEASLAQKNLSGTPFGESIMARTRQNANQAPSQVGPQMAMQFLQQIPSFTLAQASNIMSGLGPAVQGNLSTKGQTHSLGNTFSMGAGGK